MSRDPRFAHLGIDDRDRDAFWKRGSLPSRDLRACALVALADGEVVTLTGVPLALWASLPAGGTARSVAAVLEELLAAGWEIEEARAAAEAMLSIGLLTEANESGDR